MMILLFLLCFPGYTAIKYMNLQILGDYLQYFKIADILFDTLAQSLKFVAKALCIIEFFPSL